MFICALFSHMVWWPLKSPPINIGLSQLKKKSMSATSQSPFGTYREMKSVGVLDEDMMVTPIVSMESELGRIKGENLRFLCTRTAPPTTGLLRRSFLRTW